MKLAIVTPRIIKGDGQGRVNYEVAWEALHRGHSVTLIATEIAPELQQQERVDWVPVLVEHLPTQLLQDLAFSWQSGWWLQRHRSQVDVVKVNGCITWVRSDLNAVHFVHHTWLHSPAHTWNYRRDLYGAYQWFYTALNAVWEKREFRRATTIVAVSERARQELLAMGIPAQMIQVITNGVDLQEFCPGAGTRSHFNLPEGVRLAAFVGDIRTPRKNLETVIHALVEVPELHLAVVGATQGSPYPTLVKQLQLQERVHFLGQQRSIATILQCCDFFVFPSRYETFGLVVLEAMAVGLPVITASTTGAAELITPASGVVLAHPDDTPGLILSLKTLTHDLALCQTMGQAARAIAERYTWDCMSQRYVDLLEKLNPC